MLAPFAYYFGIKPWEFDRLEHRAFLALETLARRLMERGGADGA